ncbi:MAG: class I SAM-dependent methyltransferase [Candidatus Latescibacterota bacterium]
MAWFQDFFGEDYLKFDRHEDTAQEVDFVERELDLPHGSALLDLCCGYGRHAIELARRGVRVTGYDLSSVMLTRAQKNAKQAGVGVQWQAGDVRALDFEETFDGIISMFTSFGYFEDEDENFRVLGAVGRALKPGGRFLIETVNRDFIVRHFVPRVWFREGEMTVLEERAFDPISSRSRVDVTVIEAGKEKRLEHSVRVYSYTEMEMLLAASGLRTLEVFGDFDGSAYTWDEPRMIVLAEKG